ncbi:MAG: hypothetical protein HC850_01165 [Rhodomicrobium sp.]|nr:hypothetical protein [Rhodomicrobium sp.]
MAAAEPDYLLQTGTALGETDSTFEYKMFDYNRDGRDDLIAIKKSATGTGSTEIHIFDGAANFSPPLLHTGTMLHETGGNFEFEVADWNRDGFMDLVAIKQSQTGTGTSEVHVYDGSTNFATPLLHTGTALGETGDNVEFEVADWNGDGRQDLVAFMKSATGTGTTEVHILDGATNFSTFLLQTGTGLHETGDNFEFDLLDHNGDGRLDMAAVKKNETGSASTEVHVFDGASNFATPLLQTGTALHETDGTFEFEITDWNRDGRADLAAIKKSATGTGSTEVHVLNAVPGAGANQSITYDGPLIFGDRIVNRDLVANQAIRSANGRYLALMQGDGNFVVYDQAENRALWASGTDGKAQGGRVVMQADGNVAVYDGAGQARWDAGSWGEGVNRSFSMVMQDDGNLVVYDSQGGEATWSSMGGRLERPEGNAPDPATLNVIGDRTGVRELFANDALISANGRYTALMQGDGNFVVYDGGRAIWASGTDGVAGARIIMQGDGNLVVYDPSNRAHWDSGSWGEGANRQFNLVMQDDGNLVVYDSQGGEALWASMGGRIARPEANA